MSEVQIYETRSEGDAKMLLCGGTNRGKHFWQPMLAPDEPAETLHYIPAEDGQFEKYRFIGQNEYLFEGTFSKAERVQDEATETLKAIKEPR